MLCRNEQDDYDDDDNGCGDSVMVDESFSFILCCSWYELFTVGDLFVPLSCRGERRHR